MTSRPISLGGVAESSPAARYRPLLLLGHGGMGSVEAVAEELEDGTTRVVALKRILRTATTDASRLEMFLREAQLTTLLDHPNVIRSLAYGESAGEVFLAMEYVSGEPLSRLISVARERGEVLPVPLIAFILAEACEGLHAAHELRGPDGELLGVVHRDVSPHNVMVGYDGTVKLLDFGVAKINLVECAARTKTGEVKGKTAYMSPEQAMGDTVDRRSDLYSMGAVLFECLTGQRMWGNGTDFDVLRRLALEDAPRLADVLADAPPGLAALHAQLIERDPALRPATAHDLAMELRRYATGADASVAGVRATMARLFEAERKRRETVIATALGGGEPVAAAALPAGASARTGESAPVFITHRGAAAPVAARRPWLVAVAAAIAAVLGTAFGLAYRTVPAHDDPLRPALPANAGATETVPPTPAGAQSATPSVNVESATGATSEARSTVPVVPVMPPKPPTALGRRLAVPRASPVDTHPPIVASATPTATTPPPAPPRPKAPQPPDVDPTPF